MKKSNLKTRFRSVLLVLGVSVLLLWSFFYQLTSRNLEERNSAMMLQVSSQVMSVLEKELLRLEYTAFALSQSEQVKEFVREENAFSYHQKSEAVSTFLHTLLEPSSFVGNILIYNKNNVYSRFVGTLGNTAAARIGYNLTPQALPQHLYLELEGFYYVGYASGVYEGNEQTGIIVLLIEETRLLTLFNQYGEMEGISVALVANDTVLISNTNERNGLAADELRKDNEDSLWRKIGVTPFEVVVISDGSYAAVMNQEFKIAVIATALIFALLLLLFIGLWNRFFFRPMLKIMQGVEQLGSTQEAAVLSLTGEANFDGLVEQINTMLLRLDEKSRELLQTQMNLQNTQIEKQKAIIISLKKQINAHFTVNVLNIIKLLAEKREMEQVKEMCDGLSYLLRYANAGDEFIGGMEEFFILEKYIAIMGIRYRGRFHAEFDVDDRLDSLLIPRMLIQPILENAILHGFHEIEKGELYIRATLDGDCVTIRIVDNGRGMDAVALNTLRQKLAEAPNRSMDMEGLEHVALSNIQKRIHSYFGSEYGLIIESEYSQGTTVMITLPAKLL